MKIVLYPDVKQICEAVSASDDIKVMATKMLEFIETNRGYGLAGPQVGFNKQMFVTNMDGLRPMVYINPQVYALDPHLMSGKESCFSLPGKVFKVKRPAGVVIFWEDGFGQRQHCGFKGLTARVILHEYDHLHGFCIADRGKEVKSQ